MTFFYNIKISLYFNKNTVEKDFWLRAREKKEQQKEETERNLKDLYCVKGSG